MFISVIGNRNPLKVGFLQSRAIFDPDLQPKGALLIRVTQLRPEFPVVFPFALGRFTSTPAVAATPLMRGLHATAIHHIPALTPVKTPFPKLA